MIEECYSHSKEVLYVLDKLYSHITKAIRYLDEMNNEGDVVIYNAFLGGVNRTVVMGVLNRILKAGAIYNSKTNSKQPPGIVCVAEGNPATRQQYQDCLQPHVGAFHTTNTPYIFLCPSFPSQDLEPRNNDCAKLNNRRTKLSYSPIGGLIQTSMLLHELVHVYLQQVELKKEVYEINEVIALPARMKAVNPSNYVFFVGSEFVLHSERACVY